MGNYASTDDLKARFENDAAVAHLTDTADTGDPNTTVLNEVIDRAEAQLDAYIGLKHEIPVKVADHPSLANIMKSLTLDVAQRHLYARHHQVTEAIKELHDEAIQWAKDVASSKDGIAVLPTTDTEPTTLNREPLISVGSADASLETSRRIFTRETMDSL